MIKRYCQYERIPIVPIVPDVLSTAYDEEGNVQVTVVKESFDSSVFGDFKDWSLDAMRQAGIDPKSFSSPSVVGSRLGVASEVQNIDLSGLDNE